MKIIDTHAHLYDDVFKNDINQVVEKLYQVGVVKVLLPNTSCTSIKKMVHLKKMYPNLFEMMIGIHPEDIDLDYHKQLQLIYSLLEQEKFIAIGEIGLDYKISKIDKDIQKSFFEHMLNIAKNLSLPVSIHCREAFHDMNNILKRYYSCLYGVIHCFTGTITEAQTYIDLGFYLGIGGIVTFKNYNLRTTLRQIPLKNILLETDSPFLAPIPYRGQRNDSSKLSSIINVLSEIYDISQEDIARITTDNAKNLFNIVI